MGYIILFLLWSIDMFLLGKIVESKGMEDDN